MVSITRKKGQNTASAQRATRIGIHNCRQPVFGYRQPMLGLDNDHIILIYDAFVIRSSGTAAPSISITAIGRISTIGHQNPDDRLTIPYRQRTAGLGFPIFLLSLSRVSRDNGKHPCETAHQKHRKNNVARAFACEHRADRGEDQNGQRPCHASIARCRQALSIGGRCIAISTRESHPHGHDPLITRRKIAD